MLQRDRDEARGGIGARAGCGPRSELEFRAGREVREAEREREVEGFVAVPVPIALVMCVMMMGIGRGGSESYYFRQWVLESTLAFLQAVRKMSFSTVEGETGIVYRRADLSITTTWVDILV